MEKMFEMMRDMELNPPTDINILKKIESQYQMNFPVQYLKFMKLYNGGEGPIGEYGYLAIWEIEELISYNFTDITKKPLPMSGLIYFASDRGGTLFAFDGKEKNTKIVELEAISANFSEDVDVVANSFDEFIEYNYNIDYSEFE